MHLQIYGFHAPCMHFVTLNLKGATELKYNFLTHPAQINFNSQVQQLAEVITNIPKAGPLWACF